MSTSAVPMPALAANSVAPAPTDDPVKAGKTPKGSTTEHVLDAHGLKLAYRATAEWLLLRKREKPIAEMFSVYYAKSDEPAARKHDRPVTFIFNGGPGASSAYLHVGALGPKRVKFAADGSLLPPPARLTDNEATWLSFSDLVFVDPIGTGFSRAIEDEPPKGEGAAKAPPAGAGGTGEAKENEEFFAVNRDLEALGEFISRFLSKHGLWSRPIFIAGESYGGFRVAKLARKLQESHGVGLNGAILISPALELSLLEGSDYDILMWADLLPSLAAAAVHHGRSRAFEQGTALDKVLPEAERFAIGHFARYLAAGEAMPENERAMIAARAADLMGLPLEYVTRKAGRVVHVEYARELLRDERKVVGLYDATATAIDPFPDRDTFQGADPTLYAIERVFTSGVNAQLRERLEVETERDYQLLSMKVNASWKNDLRRHVFESQLGATDDLRYGMALNPHMKVMISHGVYDLVTPYFASNRLAGLMKLTPEQKANLTLKHFKGGHMFYAWEESRRAFTDAAREFYAGAMGSAGEK